MNDLKSIIGKRIRDYRQQQGLSQEKLAERAGCHATYIGQIERGEKNATLESIQKIAEALQVPLSLLFEKIESPIRPEEQIPAACYEWLLSKSIAEQETLFHLLNYTFKER